MALSQTKRTHLESWPKPHPAQELSTGLKYKREVQDNKKINSLTLLLSEKQKQNPADIFIVYTE